MKDITTDRIIKYLTVFYIIGLSFTLIMAIATWSLTWGIQK